MNETRIPSAEATSKVGNEPVLTDVDHGGENLLSPDAAAPSNAHSTAKSSHAGGLFPGHWVSRWPILIALSAVIIALEATGHVMIGLEGWGKGVEAVAHWLRPGEKPSETHAAVVTRQQPLPVISLSLTETQTRALDGYQFTAPVVLPEGLTPGPILPGGGRTRLVIQATDSMRVLQIDILRLEVKRIPLTEKMNIRYTVDPRKQSGFGGARPKQFYVALHDSSEANIFYVDQDNTAHPVTIDNILPRETYPIMVLDAQAGLQEALDFNIVATQPGIYEIHFEANVTSGGKTAIIRSEPIYVAHK